MTSLGHKSRKSRFQTKSLNEFKLNFMKNQMIWVIKTPSLRTVPSMPRIRLSLVFIFVISNISFMIAQQTVSGTVSDPDGVPLPGASVVEKGTTNGTQSNFDGNFTLEVIGQNSVLVVSYVGYAAKEIIVGAQTQFSVTLEIDAAALDDVVVVGYGTQKRANVSGAVSSIMGEDVNEVVTGNASSALVGKATGVRVEVNGGAPGAGTNVIIRGTGSLSNQDPLYVIDGVFSDNMDFLNPSDIFLLYTSPS